MDVREDKETNKAEDVEAEEDLQGAGRILAES
jgi:hypothetical protein